MSLSHPQERRYSALSVPSTSYHGITLRQLELPSRDVHSEDVDKHSDIKVKF